MRQVQILIRSERADGVLELARSLDGQNPAVLRADGDIAAGEARSLVLVEVPNDRVGSMVAGVHNLASDAQMVVLPNGALTLRAPLDRVDAQTRDVSLLSTFELVLGSLQSVGSWSGLIVFSALAGVIAAYALVFDSSSTLVAAMLVNPMGAPALVSAVGASVGDRHMLGRGAWRFAVALVVQALAAMIFGYAYRLEQPTALITQVTSISTWAALLALAAGAAGAQTLATSERDNLVTGTAAGFMVAATLAPAAAILGLAAPLRRADFAAQMSFLLALQYAAIVTGAALTLALRGVRSSDPTLSRGSGTWRAVLLGSLAVVTAALAGLQVTRGTSLSEADVAREASELASQAVREVEGAAPLTVRARFATPSGLRERVLLVDAEIARTDEALAMRPLEATVRDAIAEEVSAQLPDVALLVDVRALPGAVVPQG